MHRTLSSIVQKGTSSIKLSDVSSSGKYPVFGASGLVGYLDTFQTDVESVAVIKDGAGVGRSQIIPPNSSVLGTIQLIRPNAGIKASYIKYLIDSMHLGNTYTGATIPHIYFKDYGEKRIPNHSEFERRNICKVLDGIIDETKLLQRQIDFLDEQVKSLFNEMFGSLTPTATIGELCSMVTVGIANSATHAYRDTGVIMLRNQNIKEGFLDTDDLIRIDPSFANKYKNKALKKNDILVIRTGYPGIAALVPEEFEGCQTFTTLIARPLVNGPMLPEFMVYCINSPTGKEFVSHNQVGAAQQNFGAKVLDKMPTIVPDLKCQREFLSKAQQINKLRFNYQQQIKLLNELLEAKMAEYFGGEE